MQWIDWVIVCATAIVLVIAALKTRKYTLSVADYMAAGRRGGRYLMQMSNQMAGTAAIGIVAGFQMYYLAGFSGKFWQFAELPIGFFLAISGWVIYRYRQTRVLSIGQFFEIRYSKKFRVFMGIVAWLGGIINFGIFPAVTCRFFIHFCGLPQTLSVFGLTISTLAVAMLLLILLALFFTFIGGQITVMVTDFLQSAIFSLGSVIIIAYIFWKFDWSLICQAMANRPPDQSMLNPFDTTKVPGFNMWYYLIGMFGSFYGVIAWQGAHAYNHAARDANEFRMANVIGGFRNHSTGLVILVLALTAFFVMHSQDYLHISQEVNTSIETAGLSKAIQSQMLVPTVLTRILPVGLLGLFCTMIFAAFLSTHDTYLHSWGSIFVQDVILPFRKKPFEPKQHLRLLRLSTCFVALFIFVFGLVFKQTEYIYMYFYITGSIYVAGVGAVIIGGLYWKKGTTSAAWVTMIFGSTASVATLIAQQLWPLYHEGADFPVNGVYMGFGITLGAIVIYAVISLVESLLTVKGDFNLDRMLHRGKYAIEDETQQYMAGKYRLLEKFGFRKESARKDLIFCSILAGWVLIQTGIFLTVLIRYLFFGLSESGWIRLWSYFTYLFYGMLVVTSIWFTIGGAKDVKRMFADLKVAKRNDLDDGMVVDRHNRDEGTVTHSE